MIINATGHDINVNGVILPADGFENMIRLNPPEYLYSMDVCGFEVAIYKDSETARLPPFKQGTYYIVSRIVAEHNRDRADLLISDTTKNSVVRLPGGEIYMVTRLSSLHTGYVEGDSIVHR